MAARVIAQLIIKGSTILAKAFVTAYQQALHNAKAGGGNAPNTASTMTRSKNKLHLSEAFQILNIEKSSLSKTILEERYKKLLDANDPKKGGSFYLQSKVFRANQVLENEFSKDSSDGNKDANR
eukprot:gene24758-32241_t